MPNYSYKARDGAGKLVQGMMDAPSQAELVEKLRKLGYVVTRIQETRRVDGFQGFAERIRGVRLEDLILFNIQLSNMINAGLPILTSLDIIGSQVENKRFKEIVKSLVRSIEGGASLSEALAQYPKAFSRLFVSMIKAGEASGKLDIVLKNLAIFAESQAELREKVRSALFYPAILSVAATAVILFIVTYIIPVFAEIFAKAQIPLPFVTRMLLFIGLAIRGYWYLFILGVAITVMAFKVYYSTKAGRLSVDAFKLKLPLLGSIFRKVSIARFARTLATLNASGVPILKSLEIVEDVAANAVIEHVIAEARSGVREGGKISEVLKLSGEFPLDVIQMVRVGEETGDLDGMLNKVADFYETSVMYRIKKLSSLLEPIFLVIMGVVVAFIMASMLIPMFDMIKTLRR